MYVCINNGEYINRLSVNSGVVYAPLALLVVSLKAGSAVGVPVWSGVGP